MKVYFSGPPDQALNRINRALAKFAPGDVEIVTSPDPADLVVIHVVGRQDHIRRLTDHLSSRDQKYVIIQLSLRRTLRPHTSGWLPIWQKARLVCSFYNLPTLCAKDTVPADFNFYYTPWGVDATVFKPAKTSKKFIIATSGSDYLTEGVREAVIAAREIGRPVFHVGRELNLGSDVVCSAGMTDTELARRYSACEFVAGLRRFEGFELPCVEGLLCGARPIMFDAPHYRAWFAEFAEFIPENSRTEVIKSLTKLFRRGARPVTPAEIRLARQRFNWAKIVPEFWHRLKT